MYVCILTAFTVYLSKLAYLITQAVDPKAGGGGSTTIGEMAMSMLTKLDWYVSTDTTNRR